MGLTTLEIVKMLNTSSVEDLKKIRKIIDKKLKDKIADQVNAKSKELYVGATVSCDHPKLISKGLGKVTKINRTKAVCKFNGVNYSVPMEMLTVEMPA